MKDCTIGRGMTHVEERADVVHDVKDLAGTTPCAEKLHYISEQTFASPAFAHRTISNLPPSPDSSLHSTSTEFEPIKSYPKGCVMNHKLTKEPTFSHRTAALYPP
eukprot:scaffold1411_cov221-Alexandrium_tamarense.AAC.10